MLIDIDAPPGFLFAHNEVDLATWTDQDWDIHDLEPAAHSHCSHCGAAPHQDHVCHAVEAVSQVTLDEIRDAQERCQDCIAIRRRWESGEKSPYIEDERGLVCRQSPRDGVIGIFVPLELRQRILHLAHFTPTAGHPGITKQFQTMHKDWYWPAMAADIRKVSLNCHACAQQRIKLRSHQSPLTLFAPNAPLEYVAIDILGPLLRSNTGYRYILVITNRFCKLTRTVALKTITALSVARDFVDNWVICYGAPVHADAVQYFVTKLESGVAFGM